MRTILTNRAIRLKNRERVHRRALKPEERYCQILKKKVVVLIDYPDYRGVRFKGPQGDCYCEEIIKCYRNNVKCRYSGISPNFPDPFVEPTELDAAEKENTNSTEDCINNV